MVGTNDTVLIAVDNLLENLARDTCTFSGKTNNLKKYLGQSVQRTC